jgi:uncharacterized protein (DUF342 family)
MNKILTGKSGNVILELRQDSSSAWLTIKRSGRLVDEKEILDLIDEAGIRSGFEEALQLIRERGIEKEYDKPFPIAVCKKDLGKQAVLNYHFDPEAISPDLNKLNLKDLNRITYVKEGDVVAGYSDNLFERDGSIYDIFGDLITPPMVNEDEARQLAGDLVRYESRDFIAEATGYPYLNSEGKICLLTELQVKAEDVPSDIFLRSPLKLEIEGSLHNVQIAGAESITVQGNLEDCGIYTEGDLQVKGDIISCTNPGIQVLGSLKVSGIRQSRVYVKKGIDFDEYIEHSTVACDGDITGSYEESRITGGLTQSGANISIGSAGSHEGDETEIEIAISPFYRALLMQMTKEAVRLREDGDDKALDELHERIKRCESELDKQLNLFLKRPAEQKKSLRVEGYVHPRTLFRVLKHSYQIKSRQTGISLVEKE